MRTRQERQEHRNLNHATEKQCTYRQALFRGKILQLNRLDHLVSPVFFTHSFNENISKKVTNSTTNDAWLFRSVIGQTPLDCPLS